MRFRNVILSGAVSLVFGLGQVSMAGGSLSKEEVVKVLNGSGEMGDQVLESFDLGPVGVGTRLGTQFGALGGARVGPYTIPVRVHGSERDFNMELVLETETVFLGPDGKVLANGGMNAVEGSTVSEKVIRWRVQPRSDAANSDAAEEAKETGADPVQAIKALYAEVVALPLMEEKIDFELESEPVSGTLTRWRDKSNRVRRVKFAYGSDHSGIVQDVIYDESGRPRFILSSLGSWSFVAGKPNETIDRVRERRFYIDPDGLVVQVLEKYYEATGSDEAFKKAANAAKNIELKPESYASRKYVVLARDLRDARESQFESITVRYHEASARLLEPKPPLDEGAWTPLRGAFDALFPLTDSMDVAVGKYLMDTKVVAPESSEQEGNYRVYHDVVQLLTNAEGKAQAAVVVTATGLADDAIEAERYLVKLGEVGNGRMAIQFIGKQVKNWPERGAQGWRK